MIKLTKLLFSPLVISIFLFPFQKVRAEKTDENFNPSKLVLVSAQSLEHDGQTFLSINFRNEPHWHTYWKNPGDAGQPISFKFTTSDHQGEREIFPEALEWPTPKRFIEEGDILAFGYEGEYSLFYKVADDFLHALQKSPIKLQLHWLVCKHLCIPGSYELNLSWNNSQVFSLGNQFSNLDMTTLTQRLMDLPQELSWPEDLELFLQPDRDENRLWFLYQHPPTSFPIRDSGLLLPFPSSYFSTKKEEIFWDQAGNIQGRIKLHWEGQYLDPAIEVPKDGLLSPPLTVSFLFLPPNTDDEKNKAYKITRTIDAFSTTPFDPQLTLNLSTTPPASQNKGDANNYDLITTLLFALLGGLLLNVMPCVLPVISIKLFSLVSHSHENRRRLWRHNLSYSSGILFSFFILALLVLLLKSFGTQIGWGFQMQSPAFIGAMITVLFLLSLNLFDLFEFSTPGGKTLGGLKLEDSMIGDFFSGVLSTILATPCSAPFLGTALTFAFTAGPFSTILTFLCIGLGLSLPFLLTSIFPSSIRWLPRPGNWMNHLKKFLGLTLLLTIVWLLDVLLALGPSSQSINGFFTCLIFLFFAFYFKAKILPKNKIVFSILLLTSCLFFGYFFISLETPGYSLTSQDSGQSTLESHQELQWELWSKEKVVAQKGNWIFMNFTAKWCFTCKVNEKVVFQGQSFKDLVAEKNIKLMMADWTKRDPLITGYLTENGRFGVPSYFLISPAGKFFNLGETISAGSIKELIEKEEKGE